jgi:hypothetical protein
MANGNQPEDQEPARDIGGQLRSFITENVKLITAIIALLGAAFGGIKGVVNIVQSIDEKYAPKEELEALTKEFKKKDLNEKIIRLTDEIVDLEIEKDARDDDDDTETRKKLARKNIEKTALETEYQVIAGLENYD